MVRRCHFRMAAMNPLAVLLPWPWRRGSCLVLSIWGVMERPTLFVDAPPLPNDMADQIFFARRDCPAHRASSLEIWKNSGRRSYMGTHLDRGARGGAFNGHALAADPATSPRHSPHPTGCLTGKLPLPPGVDRGGLDLGVPKHCRRCLDPEALLQLSSPQVPQLIGCPSR